MTPTQCKMARVGLGWSFVELAERARVSTNTLARLERGETLYPRTIEAIQRALEAGGAEFINGDAPGVRIRTSRNGASADAADAMPSGQPGGRSGSRGAEALMVA